MGLGENVTFKLARLEKTRGQSNCFAINTDFQADLEMKSIRDGTDTLQSKQLLKVWGIYGGGELFSNFIWQLCDISGIELGKPHNCSVE